MKHFEKKVWEPKEYKYGFHILQMNNAIYSDYLFCCIISQEKNQREKTKMKKYILGYKCFSLHMQMIIFYYIRIFDDMSRNIYLNM